MPLFPCACFLGAVENLFADKHLQSYPGAHPQTYPQRHGKTQGRTRRGAARPCRAGRNSAVFPTFERYACFLSAAKNLSAGVHLPALSG